jgi:hypothetical protein
MTWAAVSFSIWVGWPDSGRSESFLDFTQRSSNLIANLLSRGLYRICAPPNVRDFGVDRLHAAQGRSDALYLSLDGR